MDIASVRAPARTSSDFVKISTSRANSELMEDRMKMLEKKVERLEMEKASMRQTATGRRASEKNSEMMEEKRNIEKMQAERRRIEKERIQSLSDESEIQASVSTGRGVTVKGAESARYEELNGKRYNMLNRPEMEAYYLHKSRLRVEQYEQMKGLNVTPTVSTGKKLDADEHLKAQQASRDSMKTIPLGERIGKMKERKYEADECELDDDCYC